MKDFVRQLKQQVAFFAGILFLACMMLMAMPPAYSKSNCEFTAPGMIEFVINHTSKIGSWVQIWHDEIDADNGKTKYMLIIRQQGYDHFSVAYFDKDKCIRTINDIRVNKRSLAHLGTKEAIARADLVYSSKGTAS